MNHGKAKGEVTRHASEFQGGENSREDLRVSSPLKVYERDRKRYTNRCLPFEQGRCLERALIMLVQNDFTARGPLVRSAAMLQPCHAKAQCLSSSDSDHQSRYQSYRRGYAVCTHWAHYLIALPAPPPACTYDSTRIYKSDVLRRVRDLSPD